MPRSDSAEFLAKSGPLVLATVSKCERQEAYYSHNAADAGIGLCLPRANLPFPDQMTVCTQT